MGGVKLIGKVSVPGLEEGLERSIVDMSKRFGISKAESARMMLREGAKVISKRKRLVISPTC